MQRPRGRAPNDAWEDPMSATVQTQSPAAAGAGFTAPMRVVVVPHSTLFYWWPVWAVGYILALLTLMQGQTVQFGDTPVLMHPSKNLGVIYTIVFTLVVLMTNVTVRGLASAVVIAVVLALTFLFAYLDWWDDIFDALGRLAIFMNLGFYVFFSTAVFGMWLAALFIFDRLNYWEFRPGQAIHHTVFGGGARAFDTHGMSVYKLRDDLFRHWLLGVGSGDLHVATTGATHREYVLPNVLFIGSKLPRIQELVAMKPDENAVPATVTAGAPE
jgi:hypothetical protein